MENDALRTCHVHGDELLPDSVRVVPGLVQFTEAFHSARTNLFPHVEDFALAERFDTESESAAVWYCPACRIAKAKWRAGHK